ncbi:hypothetical protein AEAC466_04240 [Asticcacaulis sp. AC466]|uniref:phage tail protein n=1 Tax=Asticcacaulis sp. AC466 TaxID=1282362 RepID=UPI0003C3D1B7|nr:phage tail protein [Asticcacaulis sp. AC466]ESQ85509.1 hypothetical protein AEAC466_04240 [Asticcacaulis sp. AC466]
MEINIVAVEGLSGLLDDLDHIPETQRQAAVAAINKTADRTRTQASRLMRNQVDFKASYLDERLKVTKYARGRDLTAVIRGRDRPTSLARFITHVSKGKGVAVAVKPGVARFIKRSFIFKGGTNQQNRLLAVRTDGGKPAGAYKPIRLTDKLWLIYGPSIDQVFRVVRDDVAPAAAEYLETEFNRIMDAEVFK